MSIKGFNISGTTYKVDYPELDNLPQINGNTLTGDKDTAALGLKQVAGVAYGIATSAEIDTLYQAGMIVTVGVNADGALQPKTACTLIKRESATKHLFSATDKTKVVWAECNNNTWTKGVFDYATSANMPQPATVTPHDLGIASVGSQYNKYALEDHTHAMPSAEDVGAIPDPTTKSSGQVLTYNGYSWAARTPSGGVVDSALSSSSTNPVQNKVIKAALDGNVSLLQDAIKREQINVISLESGTFRDGDGTTKIPYAPRLRNTVPIPINKYSKIEIPDGYGMWIFRLDKDLQLISAVDAWKTGIVDVSTILVDAIEYVNIAIRKTATPTADISADLSTVQSGLHFEYAPDAVKEVIESEIEKCTNNARYATGNNGTPLTILHFSDIHYDVTALKRIMADAEAYADLIDEYICTGDMVGNTAEQISSWWDENVLTCIGNHDTATYSNDAYDWTALSMADRDAYYIAPFESNWGITHTSGKSYYYKDYSTQKVRLIVMDAMLYTDNGQEATDQTTWLSGLLSSAITNNLHVLIAIHSPHGGATPIDCSFSKYGQTTMPTYANCNTPQAVVDAVASAITGGLHFIGYLVGHMHQDNIWDAENDGTQLMYCVTCASTKANQWAFSDQYRGGDFADAFNLVTIDTTNTLIKIVRGGGADIDNHMRARKAICFNYSTGENVSLSSFSSYQTKSITDTGGYYTTDTVEGALQEIGAELAGKADKTPRIAMTGADTAPTLDPNKLYVFPEMASLSPTFTAPSDNTTVNEYHFIFESGATATTTTFPAIPGLDDFAAEANMAYEVSILEGRALVISWEVSA